MGWARKKIMGGKSWPKQKHQIIYLRTCPSRRRFACHVFSSQRYPLRINGPHEQLNLLPIAQLAQPAWPISRVPTNIWTERIMDQFGRIGWVKCKLPTVLDNIPDVPCCHHVFPTSARERTCPRFSDCDLWLCLCPCRPRYNFIWINRTECTISTSGNCHTINGSTQFSSSATEYRNK